MSRPIIEIEGVGKKYLLDHAAQTRPAGSLRDSLAAGFGRWRRRFSQAKSPNFSEHEEFWALRDVSFNVQRGDCVGVIGRNGAGKSTLMKILSRITEPTTGQLTLRGRIASLLEVGTGFHTELTGRENIYLNGTILGMTRAELRRKFDEIVAFAEVEKFLDTPVKRYSSGMYMRLAFSVAAHLEPEILVVDEVLAVGDAQFQKKCLGKMGEVAKEGRTVLFVSHNIGAIMNLCQSGVYLRAGQLAATGPIEEVFAAYTADTRQSAVQVADVKPARETAKLSLRSAWVEAENGPGVDFDQRTRPTVIIEFEVLKPGVGYQIAAEVCQVGHGCLFATTTFDSDPQNLLTRRWESGRYQARFPLPVGLMRAGEYWINVAASIPCNEALDVMAREIPFTLHETLSPTVISGEGRRGAIAPIIPWNVQRRSSDNVAS